MTGEDGQAGRGRVLRALHARPGLFVLPCAWDPGSARLLAGITGVEALGTTSAGIAAVLGAPDGERVARAAMLAAIADIAAATSLPVSADLEAGYGTTPDDVAGTVEAALRAGAVGVNLEDGTGKPGAPLADPDAHASRIAAARRAADGVGVPCVLNARTDVFWRAAGDAPARLGAAVERLRRYRDAGADCVFVPGFPARGQPADRAREEVRHLVEALGGTPLNLLADPAGPLPVRELADLGVRRLSTGSGLYRAALASARAAARALVDGDGGALAVADGLPYAALETAFASP